MDEPELLDEPEPEELDEPVEDEPDELGVELLAAGVLGFASLEVLLLGVLLDLAPERLSVR